VDLVRKPRRSDACRGTSLDSDTECDAETPLRAPVYPRTQSPANASPYAQPAAITAGEACTVRSSTLAWEGGKTTGQRQAVRPTRSLTAGAACDATAAAVLPGLFPRAPGIGHQIIRELEFVAT
jgi:hypothetical protein